MDGDDADKGEDEDFMDPGLKKLLNLNKKKKGAASNAGGDRDNKAPPEKALTVCDSDSQKQIIVKFNRMHSMFLKLIPSLGEKSSRDEVKELVVQLQNRIFESSASGGKGLLMKCAKTYKKLKDVFADKDKKNAKEQKPGKEDRCEASSSVS